MNKLKFEYIYIKCDNFKIKQVEPLMSMIGGSRLSQKIKFLNFAHLYYDSEDKHKVYPIVEDLEKFHRSKTNCLVYDIVDKQSDFDKLYLYQTINARGNGFYGYVLKNSETNKMWHKAFVNNEDDELCRTLNKTFWLFTPKAREIYGEFI